MKEMPGLIFWAKCDTFCCTTGGIIHAWVLYQPVHSTLAAREPWRILHKDIPLAHIIRFFSFENWAVKICEKNGSEVFMKNADHFENHRNRVSSIANKNGGQLRSHFRWLNGKAKRKGFGGWEFPKFLILTEKKNSFVAGAVSTCGLWKT